MLRYFPRPLSNNTCTASANALTSIPFLVRMSMAIANHLPTHPSTHCSSNFFARTSIRVSFDLSGFFSASSNSQPTVKASLTAFDPRLAMHSAKSLFPSLFCSFANARSSSRARRKCSSACVFACGHRRLRNHK